MINLPIFLSNTDCSMRDAKSSWPSMGSHPEHSDGSIASADCFVVCCPQRINDTLGKSLSTINCSSPAILKLIINPLYLWSLLNILSPPSHQLLNRPDPKMNSFMSVRIRSDDEDMEGSAHDCRLCSESARNGDSIQRCSSHVLLTLLMKWKSWIQKKKSCSCIVSFHF